MTLDEAIEHAIEVAKEQKLRSGIRTTNDNECDKFSSCIKCAEEHERLAEWLEELKFIRQWKSDVMDDFCRYDVSSFEELVANARNKAIDDFTEKIIRYVDCGHLCSPTEIRWSDLAVVEMVKKLAEQLKVGGKNE